MYFGLLLLPSPQKNRKIERDNKILGANKVVEDYLIVFCGKWGPYRYFLDR